MSSSVHRRSAAASSAPGPSSQRESDEIYEARRQGVETYTTRTAFTYLLLARACPAPPPPPRRLTRIARPRRWST